jgi:hypothetical protein
MYWGEAIMSLRDPTQDLGEVASDPEHEKGGGAEADREGGNPIDVPSDGPPDGHDGEAGELDFRRNIHESGCAHEMLPQSPNGN